MTIQYQLTLEDYKEAWQPALQKQGNTRGRLLFISAVLLLCCGYFVVKGASFFDGIMAGLFGLTALLFIVVFMIQDRNIETFWKANPFLAKPLSLSTSPGSILIQSTDSRTELTWPAFTRWNETPNHFLLHLSEQTFYVVPKRAFAGETQLNEFRFLIKNIDAVRGTQQPPLPTP